MWSLCSNIISWALRKKYNLKIQEKYISSREIFLITTFNSDCVIIHLGEARVSVMCICVTELYIYTLSIIFWKCTSTVQLCTSLCLSELWISTESFFDLIFCALYPNTNSIESITLDFPLPFGPMMHEKRWEKGEREDKKFKKMKIKLYKNILHPQTNNVKVITLQAM